MSWNTVPNPGDDIRQHEPSLDCPWPAHVLVWEDGDCGVEMAAGGGIDNVWPLGPPAASNGKPWLC